MSVLTQIAVGAGLAVAGLLIVVMIAAYYSRYDR